MKRNIVIFDSESGGFARLNLIFRNNFNCHHYNNYSLHIEMLKNQDVDLFLFIIHKTDGEAFELLKKIHESPKLNVIPKITIADEMNVDLEIRLVSLGVMYFFTPDYDVKRFYRTVDNLVRFYSLVTQINPLSLLPGNLEIRRIISRGLENKDDLIVGWADIDNFKVFNDTLGYFEGDRIIKMTAWLLMDMVKTHDAAGFVGHIGGDDFTFLVKRKTGKPIGKDIVNFFDLIIRSQYGLLELESIGNQSLNIPEILTITVAMTPLSKHKTIYDISKHLAHLKEQLKGEPESNYSIS